MTVVTDGSGSVPAPAARRPASVTIVVPTYREAANLPSLIERIHAVASEQRWEVELLIMDDDSQDGSRELIETRGAPWVQLITRTANRGLSAAVLDGLARARHDYLVVMDADLSHPPEAIPALLAAIDGGADFAVGSRFVDGGSTDDEWGFFRWLNSRVATLLARPLTTIRDPMSGFFALKRDTFMRGADFNPIGYKIGLELLLKCRCQKVVEIPIHFADRQLGQSKLCLKEQLRYIQHIRRLYIHKYGTWSHLVQFLVVGSSGLAVNLVVLTLLLAVGASTELAVALAISLSMVWNFALNRRFSFSYARSGPLLRQFVGFVAACSLGAIINYATTITILWASPGLYPQVAAILGVLAGLLLNFAASRYLVFRARHCHREQL